MTPEQAFVIFAFSVIILWLLLKFNDDSNDE